jgi:hypothetical protein
VAKATVGVGVVVCGGAGLADAGGGDADFCGRVNDAEHQKVSTFDPENGRKKKELKKLTCAMETTSASVAILALFAGGS